MIVETGHFALVLAFVLALIQSVVPVWGALTQDRRLMDTAAPMAVVMFLLVSVSFAALTWAYLASDFSVVNVWENSHSAKPLIFKISGVWGNHEGSMLLWVLILVLFGALVGLFSSNVPAQLRATTLGVQGWITAAFLLFVLATSNPFGRIPQPPLEGNDLNPLLQDIGLAIHPPLLYLGYVGFSVTFAFAVAALILGRIDAAWARWVRPWALMAWVFLTLGISMGSYWAYYELGWGGWWFWDPVENASLMPWLAGTALLHSAIVMEKREALKVWTVLLAIFTFSLSLLGTFLVRSGVLTSVHSFAVDPARGLFILVILCLFIGGSLTLYAWRAPLLKQGGLFAPISREGALVLNNLFLTAATAAVLVGTLYPLALEAVTGEKISVGPPFFNLTFGPLMIPLMLAVPFGPLLAWKRGDILAAAQRLYAVFGVAILITLAVFWAWGMQEVLAPIGVGVAVWIMVGSLAELAARVRFGEIGASRVLSRLAGLPRSTYGTVLGHFGIGVTTLGIVMSTAFQTEIVRTVRPNDTFDVAGYQLTFTGIVPRQGPNFNEQVGHFDVRKGGTEVGSMDPSKRIYPARGMPTTEASILTFGFSQLYVSLGETRDGGGADIRAYYKPMITLIWIGTLFMSLGGLISLTDRRLRVGAPKPARNKAAGLSPAE
ncbi:heme lyase CcmF/NrfE family subunit [Pannonibacter tanglangensis]|uniref:Heme lyase CcmF/NrfE family subunit n=1 Tax=Pannonibacter tanglangensis TaxID=2750084 RepID=A0ABW9ZFV7_9HYPH|nr:heme lyase CcmF/NrfE family subunit [Pannonibacter sp. XCT-34]NBN62872.1 heme lyase CcmF/NrfE family subunit [Pannonibacter sp. XCT-34]